MKLFFYRNKTSILMFLADALGIFLALAFAFFLRFDLTFPSQYHAVFWNICLIMILAKPVTFYFFGLYRGMYRYTSIWDIITVLKAATTAQLIIVGWFYFYNGFQGIPRSIFLIDYLTSLGAVSFLRVGIRLYYTHLNTMNAYRKYPQYKRIVIIGAGTTGERVSRDILTSYTHQYKLVAFYDDDLTKDRSSLHGIQVFYTTEKLLAHTSSFDEILIAVPSADRKSMKRLIALCKTTGKSFKTMPTLSELLDKQITLAQAREVSITDLLGRDEVDLKTSEIEKFLTGKRILITGGGGSIGSELVRQVLNYNIASLCILDNSEQNLFSILEDIKNQKLKINVISQLANIKNLALCNKIFSEFQPQIIVHAAAYKHVPIQEYFPWQAIDTNITGTRNLIDLANRYRVEKFILVSTDKAVHPHNIMGASKRVAELLVQEASGPCRFVAVRFGNVIGSSGSVIPTFQKQIAEGGPVTITHPDITRFFMSIPEAAQLILQAGTLSEQSGDIFILDMGDPIRIRDMAIDLIRLSGYEPEKDISIVYTGLRPGEKMFEELSHKNESLMVTGHRKIQVLQRTNVVLDNRLNEKVNALITSAGRFDTNSIIEDLLALVPEYSPSRFHYPDKKEIPEGTYLATKVKGEA